MEADLARAEPDRFPDEPDRYPDEAVEARKRLLGGIASWTALGFLMGGMCPGIAALTFPEPWAFAGYIVAAQVVGALSGALWGVLDVPGRLRVPLALRIVGSVLLGIPIGVLWAGGAGAAGGLGLAGSIMAYEGVPTDPDLVWAVIALGAVFGAVVGTPGVVVFSEPLLHRPISRVMISRRVLQISPI